MDGSYKLMELRVSWKVPHASAADARRDDAHRDHEQDFLAFVHAVVAGLASSAAVSWQSTSGKKKRIVMSRLRRTGPSRRRIGRRQSAMPLHRVAYRPTKPIGRSNNRIVLNFIELLFAS
jgi:hypothetical protein